MYFLLEAYLATASRRDALKKLSARITRLPLIGRSDARSRVALLTDERDAATNRRDEAACCAIHEALSVFSTAFHRLDTLESNRPRAPGDGADQSSVRLCTRGGRPEGKPAGLSRHLAATTQYSARATVRRAGKKPPAGAVLPGDRACCRRSGASDSPRAVRPARAAVAGCRIPGLQNALGRAETGRDTFPAASHRRDRSNHGRRPARRARHKFRAWWRWLGRERWPGSRSACPRRAGPARYARRSPLFAPAQASRGAR